MTEINSPSAAAMAVAASALKAQQSRMRVTMLPEGVKGVAMTRVAQDQTPFRQAYEPSNPAADGNGYVKMPNVEPLTESLDMREAQRAYNANISVIETARAMDSSTLDLIKK
jgi:flagellar basal-body rod protein FlgC